MEGSVPIGEVKCPRCNTAGFYYRQSDKHLVCKKCGHEWPAPQITGNDKG